ncbi:MAG: T9SS type A sorting domain-containing protein [Bacteroidota bacterium]
MIKKLLSTVLLMSTVGIMNSSAQATCTPNISCVHVDSTFGICPDSATGIYAGNVGVAYSQTMSIKIPASTTAGGQVIPLTHLALTTVLVDTNTVMADPANWVDISVIGLTYMGNGANTPQGGASGPSGYTMTKYCYWNANGTACVIVSGTPTKAGVFPIKIESKGRASIGFGQYIWSAAPDNTDYRLTSTGGAAGIESLSLTNFDVAQNAPNPFNEKTAINFTSVNTGVIDFKVYDLLGSVVYNSTVKADKGMNTITLEANSFAPGVYMYAIKNGNSTITKRMVVSK